MKATLSDDTLSGDISANIEKCRAPFLQNSPGRNVAVVQKVLPLFAPEILAAPIDKALLQDGVDDDCVQNRIHC